MKFYINYFIRYFIKNKIILQSLMSRNITHTMNSRTIKIVFLKKLQMSFLAHENDKMKNEFDSLFANCCLQTIKLY